MSVCDFPSCGRPIRAKRLCTGHWKQQRAGLDLVELRVRVMPGRTDCSVEGCERPHNAHGYCALRGYRVSRFGDPFVVPPRIKGEVPTISAMHWRIRSIRGRAIDHACIDCGRKAQEWSYNNADPDELFAEDHGSLLAYSLNLDNYDPRCALCHRRFDRAHRSQREAVAS